MTTPFFSVQEQTPAQRWALLSGGLAVGAADRATYSPAFGLLSLRYVAGELDLAQLQAAAGQSRAEVTLAQVAASGYPYAPDMAALLAALAARPPQPAYEPEVVAIAAV